MQYPMKKFVFALSLGRAVRYAPLAFLAARYGRRILAYFTGSNKPTPIPIALIIVACVPVTLIVIFRRHRPVNYELAAVDCLIALLLFSLAAKQPRPR